MPAAKLDRLLSARSRLQEQLPEFMRARRWFGGKARVIRGVEVADTIAFGRAPHSFFLLVRVRYQAGPDETYSVPLIEAAEAADIPPSAPYMRVEAGDGAETILYDATSNLPFLESLLQSIQEEQSFQGEHRTLRAVHTPVLAALAPSGARLPPQVMRAEQSNSSVAYGDRLILKIFRRLEEGINPDLEIGRFLTERTSFRNVPPLAGYLEYGDGDARMSLAMLQSFVRNRGDAWEFTLGAVQEYFERILPVAGAAPPAVPALPRLELARRDLPPEAQQLIGDYLDSARLLGRRTAELHLALAGSHGDPAFDPEAFGREDQQALCEGAQQLLRGSFRLLRQQLDTLPPAMQEESRQALNLQGELEALLRLVETRPLTALRTRIHGDYHLGQVLVSEDDFIIIDFEGEPARPLSERRRKRSPLQDVAGMLRSFHYAAYAPLLGAQAERHTLPLEMASPWAYCWQQWVSAAFLGSYLLTSGTAAFIPRDREELTALLDVHLVEKAVYELAYELNNRPLWVRIPLSGILQLADARRS